MSFVIEVPDPLRRVTVMTDVAAAEQILFNLVDNACKYAADAEDRRIHLQASSSGQFVGLSVRDHGPGVLPVDRRRLFRPFSKSARDAAGSAPGVGLGLALSRRLARSLRGDLYLDRDVAGGACFVLTMRNV
jgi:signal transduction histidine kinase